MNFPPRLLSQRTLFFNLIKNFNFWIILSIDILLLLLSYSCSNLVRFELSLPEFLLQVPLHVLLIVVCVKLPVFYAFGLYRGMWRYTNFHDVLKIVPANIVASALFFTSYFFFSPVTTVSRAIFILDFLLCSILITTHRVLIRFAYERFEIHYSYIPLAQMAPKKRLILIGSGDAADKVLTEIHTNPSLPYQPIGLVDDDPRKIGYKLHGIPVVGLCSDLVFLTQKYCADEILISTVVSGRQQMRKYAQLCQQTHLPYKILPSMGELINGEISIKSIRDISYKDLLGREEVKLDQQKIGDYISGKAVMITGAGGSIGSELCRQVIKFSPRLLVLFDSSEANLYSIQMEIAREHTAIATVAILGKIQDKQLLSHIFGEHQPTVLFHTAAYKHVPLVEKNPWQAIDNNIVGTSTLMEAAIQHKVDRFVLVSTDKAVRPTSVMGASKRITELLMAAYNQHCSGSPQAGATASPSPEGSSPRVERFAPQLHQTRFMCVRFGNVLGSSGSVIPLFRKQIERGGPVTVTHKEVTRFFMSAEEAAQLILQSGSMGKGGEIFILKMGEPIKIDQMARELIKLSGQVPDSDIEIRYIGLRSGEKLYEELITQGEGIVDTSHEKIMVLRSEAGHSLGALHQQLERLTLLAHKYDSDGIKAALQEIIPEYTPDYGDAGALPQQSLLRPSSSLHSTSTAQGFSPRLEGVS